MNARIHLAAVLILAGAAALPAEGSFPVFQDGGIMKMGSGAAEASARGQDPAVRFHAEIAGLILVDPAAFTAPGWGGRFSFGAVIGTAPDPGQYQDNHWLDAGVLSLLFGGSAYGIALALGGEQDAAVPVGLITALYTLPNALRYGLFSETGAVTYLGSFLAGMGSYFGGGFWGAGSILLANAASYMAGFGVGSSTGYRFTYEETPAFGALKLKPYHTLDLESLGIGSDIGRYSFWTGFRHRYTSLPGFVLRGASYAASGASQWDYAPEAILAVRFLDVLVLQGGMGGMKIYERGADPKRPLADFFGWKDLSFSLSAGLNWEGGGVGYTYRAEGKSQAAGEIPADTYTSEGRPDAALGWSQSTHGVSATFQVTEWLSAHAQVSYASVDYRVFAVTGGRIAEQLAAVSANRLSGRIGMRIEVDTR